MVIIAFRVDASLQIGSGHVMRCLTFADALRERGAMCRFSCRPQQGHLLALVAQRGHHALALPELQEGAEPNRNGTAHGHWLGTDWATDAKDTQQTLSAHMGGKPVDWLVVDHYALDARWEDAMRPQAKRIMVIDDLADRPHACDLLLDQNLGCTEADYGGLLKGKPPTLVGPQYALLRPEFAALRLYSLQRRQAQSSIQQLLITMGGVDQDNATGLVLHALKACTLPADCRITVVMGLTAPWLQNVRELAAQMPWPTEVVVNVNDMAQRMADSDMAIGAAGSTLWERCCLGLPTLIAVLAENQQPGALAMEAAHAARLIGAVDDIATQLPSAVAELIEPACRSRMSLAASAVTDGRGIDKVLSAMGVIDD